jgi:leader peptidase (prepilin peptidase)/N-methyltransferase
VLKVLASPRCRVCGARLDTGVPVVECVTGSLVAASFMLSAGPAQAVVLSTVCLVAVTTAAVDMRTYTIPNRLVAGGGAAVAALIAAGLIPPAESLLGAVAGGSLMWVTAVAGRGAMGGGDVKISFVLGALVRWPGVLVALFASFVAAALTAAVLLALRLKKRRDYIPFGPFLAAGALFAAAWGDAMLRWYWGG